MARLPKKSFFGVLLLVVLMLVTMRLTDFDRIELTPVEILLRDILAPLQSGVTGISGKISAAVAGITEYQEISDKYLELQRRVGTLVAKLNRMEEYRQENVRLRKLLNLKQAVDGRFNLLAATVIARDASNWYHTITVDRGANAGVERNMPVVNHQGLVGRVIAVTDDTAEVLLLMDPEGAAGGLIQATRTPGIVKGSGEGDRLNMIHLAHDAPVMENQVVVTSGLGDIFPKGLRIGYITGTRLEANGLVKQAQIRPFVDFDRLEEVFVITGTREDG